MAHSDPEGYLEYLRYSDEVVELRRQRRQQMQLATSPLDDAIQVAEEKRRELGFILEQAVQPQDTQAPADLETLLDGLSPGQTVITLALHNSGVGLVGVSQSSDGSWKTECTFIPTPSREYVNQLILGGIETAREFRSPEEFLLADASAFGWVIGLAAVNAGMPQVMQKVLDHVCRSMGEDLWPAIEAMVGEHRDILLVAGAGLNLLPLHAAILGDGVRACDKYRITYAPSVEMHRRVRQSWSPASPVKLGQAVNPSGDLRYAEAEATAVAGSMPNYLVKSVSSVDASRDAVTEQLLGVDIFHFAGHGSFDAQDPLDSRIVCADGDLTLRMLLQQTRPIRVGLAILSACESGVAEVSDVSNDSLNLPGACLAVGIPAVLATYWAVNDLATFFLVENCMRQWMSGYSLSEALARAQAWLRDEATYEVLQDRTLELMEDNPDKEEHFLHLHRQLKQYRTELRPFAESIYWAAFHVCGVDVSAPGVEQRHQAAEFDISH